MSGEPIGESDLLTLFDAARWAPSSGNSQPWRFLYARRDTPHFRTFLDLLVERNREWCVNAAALVVFISRTSNDQGRPLLTHAYDTGAAWMSVALQGWMRGFVVHGMAGFDYAKARQVLRVPDDFAVDAMCAIGRPGPIETLSEFQRGRETPSQRRPLAETAFEGPFPGAG